MSLTERINEDIKQAMKAQAKERLEALRSVKAALLLVRTEKGATYVLTEEEELKVLQKLHKQRRESADIYKTQGREDLHAIEVKEAEFISAYLPQPISETELLATLKEIIARLGASSAADFGKVMRTAVKELAGKADGNQISALLKQLLK